MEQAEALAAEMKGLNYVDLKQSIDGLKPSRRYSWEFLDELEEHLNIIAVGLNTIRHPFFIEQSRQRTVVQDGPKTAHELSLCYNLYLQTRRFSVMPGRSYKPQEGLDKSILELISVLDEIQDDIPYDNRQQLRASDMEDVGRVLQSHFIDEMTLLGLTHHYLRHSVNRLYKPFYARLDSCLSDFVMESVFEAAERSNVEILDAEALHTGMWERLFMDYPTPKPEEVTKGVEEALKGSRYSARRQEQIIDTLTEKRASKPSNMEEVVISHCEEKPWARKLRKKFFGPEKQKFLESLAQRNAQELQDVGFTNAEIKTMRETRKLPCRLELTVEHIIDRQHGGTNHQHNFILMSGRVNRLKDELKNAQIRHIPNSSDGCWIISWAPKKNADGTFPKVLVTEADCEEKQNSQPTEQATLD